MLRCLAGAVAAPGRRVARFTFRNPLTFRNASIPRSAAASTLRTAVVACCAVALTATGHGVVPAVAASPEWAADDGGWSGTGTLLAPGQPFEPSRKPSSASEQRWLVLPVCQADQGGICVITVSCQPGRSAYGVFTLSAGRHVYHRSLCLAVGQAPVTAEQVAAEVRTRLFQAATAPRITWQPERAITGLPTIFSANSAPEISRTDSIMGFNVRLRAAGQWEWSFGRDGPTRTTTSPGGDWPDTTVNHTFMRVGRFPVTCTVRWSGQFSINGGTWIDIDPPVSLTGSTRVPVRQAVARLVE